MILACDVGGTKTSLALYELVGASLARRHRQTFASQAHASLDEIVAAFLDAAPGAALTAAGFGVAGPVTGGRARITNLPWEIDGARLAARLGLPGVALVNDVEATAWALERLGPADLAMLQAGRGDGGARAVVAVGTGVGYSALVRGDGGALSLASEAGHADFAPRSELEVALWRWLSARHGHVSVERVLSGPGLLTVYRFLLEARAAAAPPWLAEAERTGQGPAAVAAAGMEGRDPVAEQALDLFLGVCGAEAGNWALRTLARGGLYLGGGVAAKLLFPVSARAGWREHAAAQLLAAFLDKGRFRPLLAEVPLGVILDESAALLGAAHRALL